MSNGTAILLETLREASMLTHGDIRKQLQSALQDKRKASFPAGEAPWCWLVDVIGGDQGTLVYEELGQFFEVPYSIKVTGTERVTSIEVSKAVMVMPRTVYDRVTGTILESEAVREANKEKLIKAKAQAPIVEGEESITGDTVELLSESAVGMDGSVRVKLIQPGWGSSGFYSESVLKQAARDKVFSRGTHMYWNHPTEQEESARPEGDLRDLAATLQEDAKWDATGAKGPGLYARAKVFEAFRGAVDDLAESIGVSIRALGLSKPGTVEGKTGRIVEKLTRAVSVDFVTKAGAGGEVIRAFEAARPHKSTQRESETEMLTAEDKTEIARIATEAATAAVTAGLKPFSESLGKVQTENKKLREHNSLSVASDRVRERVMRPDLLLHPATRQRLCESLPLLATLNEAGELDTAAFDKVIDAEIKREAEYFATVTGAGRVTNFGEGAGTGTGGEELTDAKFHERLVLQAKARGMSDAAAQVYASRTARSAGKEGKAA